MNIQNLRLSCTDTVKKNEDFLNELFSRSLTQTSLLALFPDAPKFLSLIAFSIQDSAMLHSSPAILLQCCCLCLEECGLKGHAFLSGHNYFIFLLQNDVVSEGAAEQQFHLIGQNLLDNMAFKYSTM